MPPAPELAPEDEALLEGAHGPAAARAMQLLLRYAAARGARRFLPITAAHIDGCLHHGPSSLDFARRFVDLGGRVRVPTTLNVAAVDLAHPENREGSPPATDQAELIRLHEALGCFPTLTCAPYQRLVRPRFGEHVAWAESNAIVFVNSVLGARTDRYGDFTDLLAALTGRVPAAGLHLARNRRPTRHFRVPEPNSAGLPRDLAFPAIGYALGEAAGSNVAVLSGIAAASEDELKALGAAAASSGAVALFHIVGLTPEAPTPARAETLPTQSLTTAALAAVVDRLCPLAPGEPVAALCFGTPHASLAEFRTLAAALANRRPAPGAELIVSTSREIAATVAADPAFDSLRKAGTRIVTDTCTYLTPARLGHPDGALLTTSAKWAHYAPANLRRRVGLVDLARGLASLEAGRLLP